MNEQAAAATSPSDQQLCQTNWQRYVYGRQRGHRDYCTQVRKCEDFFLGGGRQWSDADKAILAEQGRPAYEFNEVKPSVNSAIGYQIHNRMDIAFKPRGGKSDQDQATIRSKIAMQIADETKLHWKETQVFGDGIIQQRGYFDIRMSFLDNLQGNIDVQTRDPMDVIPDPDAKTYDPDGWQDVIVTGWLTLDEIEEQFGKKKRVEVENYKPDERDFGDGGEDEPRNKFGDSNSGNMYDSSYTDGHMQRVRVIDRQRWVYSLCKVGVWPETGDVRVIEDESDENLAQMKAQGVLFTKRMQKRVKWTVSTFNCLLHDDWSPYDHFTIVPYFAYFRRGKTCGMVDDAIGPQEALNKAVSQYIHIVNTTANSGWTVEENSLTNMKTADLEKSGSKTGQVLEFKAGSTPPKKIDANKVPEGIDRLIDRATQALKDVTVPEAMRGINGPEVAGIAIQAKQFASQQQLATPLDNLSHTRHLLAVRMLELMQKFYTSARVFRITETDPATGKPKTTDIPINQHDPATGTYTNDMTEGEYDVVITEQPMAATFEDTQFKQALELKEAGIKIPDSVLIKHSNLTDKQDILSQMEAQQQPDPLHEAEVALKQAQTSKVTAEGVKTIVEAEYSAMQGAEVLAGIPQVAPIADAMMSAAGYKSPNPAGDNPNFPGGAGPGPMQIQPVTNHRTGIAFTPPGGQSTTLLPPNIPKPLTPGIGERRGIETMRPDGMADGGIVGDEDDPLRGHLTGTERYALSVGNLQGTSAPSPVDQSTFSLFGSSDAGSVSRFGGDIKPLETFADGGYIGAFRHGETQKLMLDGSVRFANGGQIARDPQTGEIHGPGTGTSDSVPAVNVDTGAPLAVSNEEVIIPRDVVKIVGLKFFEDLIAKYHTPVHQQDQQP